MKNFIKIWVFMLLLSISNPASAEVDKKECLKLIKKHETAVFIRDDVWIRDPYIVLGPDDYYYLTGTMSEYNDPRQKSDRYNRGVNAGSIVGSKTQLWRSENLVDWEYLGTPYTIEDSYKALNIMDKPKRGYLWANEFHWLGDRWALVQCPKGISCLSLSDGADITGNYTNMSPKVFVNRHDPSLFKDDDGQVYFLYGTTIIAPLKDDYSGFKEKPVIINPKDRRIGHEGSTIIKIDDKYVLFGTGWSTDETRRGSYNLYYCTADNVMGPYSERRFLGRFLGHGTPFQDKKGKWWCTAFFNSTVHPLDSEGIETRDLSDNAYTINDSGVTIVPLDIEKRDGDMFIRAIDSRYGTPGPDEGKFTERNPHTRLEYSKTIEIVAD